MQSRLPTTAARLLTHALYSPDKLIISTWSICGKAGTGTRKVLNSLTDVVASQVELMLAGNQSSLQAADLGCKSK